MRMRPLTGIALYGLYDRFSYSGPANAS
jgi:hypothetical protein